MTLTRVAAFGRWRKLGYRVRAGEKGLRIFGPVTRRLRADEVASWLAQRRDPFDPADIGGVGRGRDPEGAQIRRHHPG